MRHFYFRGAVDEVRRRRGCKITNDVVLGEMGDGYGYTFSKGRAGSRLIFVDKDNEPQPPRNFTKRELFEKCWYISDEEGARDIFDGNSIVLEELSSAPHCSLCGAEFNTQDEVDELVYEYSSATADHYKCPACGEVDVTI